MSRSTGTHTGLLMKRSMMKFVALATLMFPLAVCHGEAQEPESEKDIFLRSLRGLDESKILHGIKRHPDFAKLDSGGGMTPLHVAGMRGFYRVAVLAIRSGASAKAKDDSGRTPLHWAAGSDELTIVKLLLANGAEINAADKNGHTPLHWAATWRSQVTVGLLLKKGADLEARTKRQAQTHGGRTALHLAVEPRIRFVSSGPKEDPPESAVAHRATVRAIAAKMKSVDVTDDGGQTPLHLAAESGSDKIVRILLDRNAKPDIADGKGRTPLDLAAKEGHAKIVDMLRRAKAQRRNAKKPTP